MDYVLESAVTPELIASRIKGYDCLIVGNDIVDQKVLDAADKLRLIHMHGTGLDGIDIESATKRGVLVANVAGANKNAVAEMVIALMMIVGRRIDKHIQLLKEGRWERSAGNEISGKTVGIIGLGNIGKRLVELLRGFEVKIVAYDNQPDYEWAAPFGVRLASTADEVFSLADFLVLALPLTEETHHLVCERTLALMKPCAYLVNTARGGLVDEVALSRAVRQRKLAGAAIDVYTHEPPRSDSPLRSIDVVLTPHIAATSKETSSYVSKIVAEQVIDILTNGKSALAKNYKQVEALMGKPR